MAIPLIVVLERTALTPVTLRYVVRANVPLARQSYFADANKTSFYKEAAAADLAALQAGQIVEQLQEDAVGGRTIAEIQALLIAAQQAFQTLVNSQTYNPYRYYGTTWDGAAWTVAGVN